MRSRLSVVKTAKVNTLQSSSVFQIGDSVIYTPQSRGYAVGQLSPIFREESFSFTDPIFFEPIPKPNLLSQVQTETFHHSPFIHVSHIKVNSLGDSSIFQIGSTNYIESEARIKHIRRFR